MKDVIKDYKLIFKNMNAVSKNVLKYGSVLILTLLSSALYFYFNGDTYFDLQLCRDLLYSVRECIGGVVILPLIGEIIFMAAGKTKDNQK
ncbi:MAG: hypothetical protein LUG85_02405 [Clostridiales bacterium]|nr:hypothetical protein [Clostridiales bacterium]